MTTTRKNFIKSSLLGLGACAVNPLTMAAGKSFDNIPKRFVFLRVGNGVWSRKLTPPEVEPKVKGKDSKPVELDLDKCELPDYLKGLNDHKENMAILTGMSCKMSMNGHHSYQSIMGLFHAKDANVNTLKRTSIDYELAKLYPSPLGHVELSFANERKGIVPGWSVPAPYQKNFCYADPITAYNNLFQCVLDPESLKLDIDMFSHIFKREGVKRSLVKGSDKIAQENHVRSIDAIRKTNNKLLQMSSQIAKQMPDKKTIYARGSGAAFSVDRQAAMTDILTSILISGLTNVVTYTMDNLDFNQTGLPGVEAERIHNHTIGHGGAVKGVPAEELRKKVRVHHFNQVKTIVERLKAQPEGNGTMFDNTMIMYFPEGGEKHHAQGTESPWVVMSGKNCNLDIAGRFYRLPGYAEKGHQTLGNWYTTILNAYGNPIPHYGDLDPTLSAKKLPQEGAIKHFIKA